jgi:hypothetical protein
MVQQIETRGDVSPDMYAHAGFKKEDFKVQVDSGGRLTVRGERPAGYVRFHKAFQLPQTAYPDGVAGRFDGTVLSLTVPKQPASGRDMVVARLAEVKECAAGEGTTTWAEALGGKGQMVAAAVAGFAPVGHEYLRRAT